MFRIENVLVAVTRRSPDVPMDGMSSARLTSVNQAAINIALVTGAQLTFCAVAAPRRHHSASNEFAIQPDEGIRQELVSLQEYATTRGIPARCLMRTGDLSEELILETFDDAYDMLMISEASTEMDDHQIGTQVIQKLLTQARCSVWATNPSQQGDIPNLGFVSLGSDNFALPFAVTFARLLNARLHVMHPISHGHRTTANAQSIADTAPKQDLAHHRQLAESELKSQLERTDFRALPFGSKLEFLEDDSSASISRYSADHQLDLLIVDRRRLVRNEDSGQSLRAEWSDLANSHSILAVVPDTKSSRTHQT